MYNHPTCLIKWCLELFKKQSKNRLTVFARFSVMKLRFNVTSIWVSVGDREDDDTDKFGWSKLKLPFRLDKYRISDKTSSYSLQLNHRISR